MSLQAQARKPRRIQMLTGIRVLRGFNNISRGYSASRTPGAAHPHREAVRDYGALYDCTNLINSSVSSIVFRRAVYMNLPICGQLTGGISSCITMAAP